jgi:small subunit ribosomal protein S4e
MIRTGKNYPTGFMDVITRDQTDERFRVIYDHKGRVVLRRLSNPAPWLADPRST